MNLKNFCLAIFVLAAYVYVNDPGHVFHAEITTHSVTVDSYTTTPETDQTPGNNIFNDAAALDNSQITYSDNVPVILPTDTTTVTPCILFGTTYVPEESPDGGHPIEWWDNSPHYSDGYTLVVDDSTHTVYWRYDGNGA